ASRSAGAVVPGGAVRLSIALRANRPARYHRRADCSRMGQGGLMSAKRSFFRHSRADAFLAVAGLGHVAFLLWTLFAFPDLPWWGLALSFVVYAGLICWNLQCISHNFIHNPFFGPGWLNRLFGVLESLAIGMPHQLYHHYHMNHHWGNNDRLNSKGTTRD